MASFGKEMDTGSNKPKKPKNKSTSNKKSSKLVETNKTNQKKKSPLKDTERPWGLKEVKKGFQKSARNSFRTKRQTKATGTFLSAVSDIISNLGDF